MKTTRYSVGSSLSATKTIALKVGHDYYLGASSSPDVVTITALSESMIDYEVSGRACRVQRWIGEDLIARGCTTKRKQLRDLLATEMGRKMDRSGGVTKMLARVESMLG